MLRNRAPKTDATPASRRLNSSLEAILFLLATLVVAAAIGPVAGWWHYEVIESGSMAPALRIGGVAVVSPEPLSAVRVGQVIAFHPPGMGNYVRIHRVVAVTDHDGKVWIRTKGDANNSPDPGPVQLVGTTAYAEHYFVPYVGYLAVWLYRSSTRVALEVVLFTLMVTGGLVLIWGKRDDEEEEIAEKQLVIPGRWPRQEERALNANRVAQKASAASMVALSHIYTASEGDDLAASVGELAPQQKATTGG